MKNQLYKVEEHLKLRNYSPKTRRNYLQCLRRYFGYLRGQFDERYELPRETFIQKYLLMLQSQNYAPQTVNLHLNAIKFYYHQVLGGRHKVNIKMGKRSRRIPVVLSHKEILRLIEKVQNYKHQLLIELTYSSGLRVGEIVKLRVKDVDLEYHCLTVRQGKGNKDRTTIFSNKLVSQLKSMMCMKQPNDYIFWSEHGGHLSERTAQKIFTSALNKTGIQKEATFHSLRHSFATHLMENGTGIRYIQEMLGHNSIRTTEIYTSVARHNLRLIKSPL